MARTTILPLRIAAAALCAVLPGGAGSQDLRTLRPIEHQQCEQRGGTVTRGGLMGDEFCLLRMSDAGRSCRSSSECLGACLRDNPLYLRAGARVKGQCQPTNSPFGCQYRVERGRLQRRLCVD